MNPIDSIHGKFVFSRRIRVLSQHIAPLIPANARLLDVGCGDGTLTKLLCELRPDITAEGVDILVRPHTAIPVTKFDGHKLPFPDASFDCVLFVDVLHHTEDPTIMLREAARVTKNAIILKDHTQEGFLAHSTLRFMDYVGNARHGVVLPYNYWTRAQWNGAFLRLGLKVETEIRSLNLYPVPATWLFDRELHFISRLELVRVTSTSRSDKKKVVYTGSYYGILEENSKYYIEYDSGGSASWYRQDEITTHEMDQILAEPEGSIVEMIIRKAQNRSERKM